MRSVRNRVRGRLSRVTNQPGLSICDLRGFSGWKMPNTTISESRCSRRILIAAQAENHAWGRDGGGVKPLYTSTAHPAYRLESPRVLLKTPHAAPAARPGPSGISNSGVGPGSVSPHRNLRCRLSNKEGSTQGRESLHTYWVPFGSQ